ncbi:unnamed protein product [Fraxinus pennsylvanica]|uniref:Uncharacterized protein n=1 Tax=Fraxinus pennsylvanica TaxID=56036 RepID=A0AAD1YTD8_9LAMI|nr:unnamed protein product [Fraxinus pennsylvanica]
MAALPPSSLQFSTSNPIFSQNTRVNPSSKFHAPPPGNHSFIPRAATEEDSSTSSETSADVDGNFEDRLSQVRLRYRSGTGKKAELRKTRKGKKTGSGSSIYLPPVTLKEPVSEGLNVEFGFSPFSERVNGRIAILGLSALFLVELATGKGVVNYHSPSIVLIQVYFMAAVSALYLKYEKEKVSVWPEK